MCIKVKSITINGKTIPIILSNVRKCNSMHEAPTKSALSCNWRGCFQNLNYGLPKSQGNNTILYRQGSLFLFFLTKVTEILTQQSFVYVTLLTRKKK